MSKVALIGLEFFGRHGVFEQEATLGARYLVDVEMEFDFADLPDTLEHTVDYGRVFTRVEHEVTQTRHKLIEHLADTLARALLLEHTRLERVTVRVHKPQAPLPGIFRDVYAEVSRGRR